MSKERELLQKVIQDVDDGVISLYLYKEVMDYLAQPEPEPVAWIATGIGGGTAVGWYEKDIVNLPKGTKLYLHPPKREPLGKRIEVLSGTAEYMFGFCDGVLYAEKAHGIGE